MSQVLWQVLYMNDLMQSSQTNTGEICYKLVKERFQSHVSDMGKQLNKKKSKKKRPTLIYHKNLNHEFVFYYYFILQVLGFPLVQTHHIP